MRHIAEYMFGYELIPIMENSFEYTYEEMQMQPDVFDPEYILPEHVYDCTYQVQRKWRDDLDTDIRRVLEMVQSDSHDEWIRKKVEFYNDKVKVLLREPLENVPLYINHEYPAVAKIAAWRLKIKK